MLLRDWRKSKNLTLQRAAPIFLLPVSTLSEIERGEANVSQQTIARIDAVTKGCVTAADHAAAWRRRFPSLFHEIRAAGRSAAASLKAAKPKRRKRSNHG